jgi:hypothetical protein
MHLLEMTQSPKLSCPAWIPLNSRGSVQTRRYVKSRCAAVIVEGGRNSKGRISYGESKDKKVCAHTMSLRCAKWRKILWRSVS